MAYTTAEAAAVAGVSSVTIWRWIQSGKLPARAVGARGRLRIDPGELALVMRGTRVRVV